MKKIGKILLWILSIIMWLTFLTTFIALEIEHEVHALYIYLIITGICLALYIWKKTGSSTKELEKENQKLKEENQRLQQELAEQAVRRAMDKAESRERKGKLTAFPSTLPKPSDITDKPIQKQRPHAETTTAAYQKKNKHRIIQERNCFK